MNTTPNIPLSTLLKLAKALEVKLEELYEWFKKSDIIKNEILGTIKSGFVDVPFHELTDEFQSYINEKNI